MKSKKMYIYKDITNPNNIIIASLDEIKRRVFNNYILVEKDDAGNTIHKVVPGCEDENDLFLPLNYKRNEEPIRRCDLVRDIINNVTENNIN